MALLKESGPKFGVHTKSMKNVKTATGARLHNRLLKVYSDRGFAGIEKLYTGAIHKQPKKKPKDGKLDDTGKRRNKRISFRRITVERVIGRLKTHDILTRPFGGTADELNNILQIISGLENLKIILKKRKYNWLLDL